ncbi:MAG: hypothetical protein Q7S31_00425 [bacterium]|nr:hypothetical protein [bacterium]
MDEEYNFSWVGYIVGSIIVGVILLGLFGFNEYEGENAEYWFNACDAETARVGELETKVGEYENSLDEANSHIEDANYQIRKAKSNAGASYSDMEYALDSLHQIDTVSEP